MYIYNYIDRYMWSNMQKGSYTHIQFSTLRLCNSVCLWPEALKFGGSTFLSLHLKVWKFWPNSLLTNEVMSLQSHKIGYMYKTLFANLVTYTYYYIHLSCNDNNIMYPLHSYVVMYISLCAVQLMTITLKIMCGIRNMICNYDEASVNQLWCYAAI